MLRIVNVLAASGGKLVIDDYIPFRFRLSDALRPSPYLWRTGNRTTSLLEIAIDRESHSIFGVTLTCFAGELLPGTPPGYYNQEILHGVPVADVSGFPPQSDLCRHSVFDEPEEIQAYRMESSVFLALGESHVPERCIRIDRIGFFECATELCGIGFFDLSPREVDCAVALCQMKLGDPK
jgi:hypothetical protein